MSGGHQRRVAFMMKLRRPELAAEYKRRHDEIWPELKILLKDAGISDYSIFLEEESGRLFAVQKISGDGGSQDLGTNPVVQRWWAYMADLMETEDNQAPVSVALPELFFLD